VTDHGLLPGLWPIHGDGVLARQGNLVLLIHNPAGGRFTDRLLDLLTDASRAGDGGLRFTDQVSAEFDADAAAVDIAAGAPGPAVVAFGSVGGGTAIAVYGMAWAEVTTAYGVQRLATGEPYGRLRCVLPSRLISVRAGVQPVAAEAGTDPYLRLADGVVRAIALVYAPAEVSGAGTDVPPGRGSVADLSPARPATAGQPSANSTGPGWAHDQAQRAQWEAQWAQQATPPPAPAAQAPAPPVPAPPAPAPPVPAPPVPAPAAYQPPSAPPPPPPAPAAPAPSPAPAAYQPPPPPPAPAAPAPFAGPVAEPEPEYDPTRIEPAVAARTAPPPTPQPAAFQPPAPAPQPAAFQPPAPAPRPVPAAQQPDSEPPGGTPQDFISLSLAAGVVATALPRRDPLPLGAEAAQAGDLGLVEASAAVVDGVYCKNGHFNDPEGRYCAVCGISMAQLTKIRQKGKRPPLGVLVLGDGSVCQLDADYVIGREPTLDSAVANGQARPLRLDGASGVVSRTHARIELDGWQVFISDLNSANGTQVLMPGERNPVNVQPGTRTPLVPGAQIRLGGEYGLQYDSHRHR
jgi:hypothetical protein